MKKKGEHQRTLNLGEFGKSNVIKVPLHDCETKNLREKSKRSFVKYEFLPLVDSEISVNMLCIYALAVMYGNSQTVASI